MEHARHLGRNERVWRGVEIEPVVEFPNQIVGFTGLGEAVRQKQVTRRKPPQVGVLVPGATQSSLQTVSEPLVVLEQPDFGEQVWKSASILQIYPFGVTST